MEDVFKLNAKVFNVQTNYIFQMILILQCGRKEECGYENQTKRLQSQCSGGSSSGDRFFDGFYGRERVRRNQDQRS